MSVLAKAIACTLDLDMFIDSDLDESPSRAAELPITKFFENDTAAIQLIDWSSALSSRLGCGYHSYATNTLMIGTPRFPKR